MDYIAELAAIAKEHGGIIETKIAAQHGISKAMLYKLCKEDRIHRIVKGQYILPDDMEDELLSISKRSTQIIFSHETALFLHGISDRTPFEHTITAPSGCIPSAAIKAECKVYYIKPELFDLGKTELKTPAGNLVPCYDLERTVCDVIRSRNKLGTETFLAALKLYAANPKKDLNKLNSYAKKMRVANILRQNHRRSGQPGYDGLGHHIEKPAPHTGCDPQCVGAGLRHFFGRWRGIRDWNHLSHPGG